MSKQSGLGDNLYVAGYDLSGDIGSLGTIHGGPAPLVVTGIDKSAMERIGGVRDGAMEYVAYFNDSAGQAHPVLSALPTSSITLTYCRGTALGSPAASMIGKQLNYDPTRATDGSLTFNVAEPADGYAIEWGRQGTAGKRTDTAATNGTSVDFGTGSTTFGLQAYLQVFAFTGTDVTIKIQSSSDNGAGDAFSDVTGAAFTAVTAAPGTQRIATANNLTIERYLRVVTTTTGGFTSVTFAVNIIRNDTLVVF